MAIHATAVFAKDKVNIVLAPKLLLMLGGLGDGEQQPIELLCRAAENRGCQRVPIEGLGTGGNTTASLE
jgi:hypothetical protein